MRPGTILIPPIDYQGGATYGVEIPQGEHEVTIALIAGAAPAPAGQPRGGAVGNFKSSTRPPNVEAWAAALGLSAGTPVYADPRWSLTPEGASLPATAMSAPLVIPVQRSRGAACSDGDSLRFAAALGSGSLPNSDFWRFRRIAKGFGLYPTHFSIGSLSISECAAHRCRCGRRKLWRRSQGRCKHSRRP